MKNVLEGLVKREDVGVILCNFNVHSCGPTATLAGGYFYHLPIQERVEVAKNLPPLMTLPNGLRGELFSGSFIASDGTVWWQDPEERTSWISRVTPDMMDDLEASICWEPDGGSKQTEKARQIIRDLKNELYPEMAVDA